VSRDADFYLHHYDASPYAEKIRAMFGATDHPWASVLSPPYPPRPALQPLVGEFRRIPVAHQGADVFCDTLLIAKEVAALVGRDSFAAPIADATARALAERAEGTVFFCAITGAPPLPLLGKLVAGNGILGTWKFVKDRSAMMKNSSQRVPRGKDAASVLQAFIGDLEAHLADREVLDGRDLSYADFCVYHPLWLAQSVGGLASLAGYERTAAWYDRMAALGQGRRREVDAAQALSAVQASQPRPLPADQEEHEALGRRVRIGPSDYGKAAVDGTLAAVTGDRFVIARDAESGGTINLHFPREGYSLTF